jgi:hypothetical protein
VAPANVEEQHCQIARLLLVHLRSAAAYDLTLALASMQ